MPPTPGAGGAVVPADPTPLTDPALYQHGDPFALYAALREQAPVAWHDNAGKGFWAVTTHRDVSSIGTDPETFCSSRGVLIDEIGTTYDSPPTMMHTDPPQHTRYRRLAQPAFKPSIVKLMEDGVTAKARALVAEIPADTRFDVVPSLSVPYPLQVICELLGVDGEQWPRFYEWSEAVIPEKPRSPPNTRRAASRDVDVPDRRGRRAAERTQRRRGVRPRHLFLER